MGLFRYMYKRLYFIVPQILLIIVLTFTAVRITPVDTAKVMLGPYVTAESVQAMRERLNLSGSIFTQFSRYMKGLAAGDLGFSWITGNPVLTDIKQRLPATLELLLCSLLVVFFLMLPIALKSMSFGESLMKKISRKALFTYGMSAGAFPDFWLALVLIFIFYSALGWVAAPVGRIAIAILPPTGITGMYLVDSLLTLNWQAFISSAEHLFLPVLVLSFVYGGAIIKTAIVSSMMLNKSPFINFMKVSGLSHSIIDKYVKRASIPNVVVLSALVFAFLLGGAVLIETVFSWPGFGLYSVQSVINADFAAIQGVVLVSALLNLLIYSLVDIVYYFVDPRIRNSSSL